MTEFEYKKCPCCGGKAVLDIAVTGIGNELVYRMICSDCGLSTRPVVTNGFDREAEATCVANWENRVKS